MAWIYDLLFVIVFAFAAVSSWRKGFLASLAELVGTVVAAGVAGLCVRAAKGGLKK